MYPDPNNRATWYHPDPSDGVPLMPRGMDDTVPSSSEIAAPILRREVGPISPTNFYRELRYMEHRRDMVWHLAMLALGLFCTASAVVGWIR